MNKIIHNFSISILIIVCFVQIVACQDNVGNRKEGHEVDYSIYYHLSGFRKEVPLEKASNVEKAIRNCISQIRDRPRLYVDDDRVSTVLEEEAWELIYHEVVELDFGSYGQQQVLQVIIPLSGYFAPSDQGIDLTILSRADQDIETWDIWLTHIPDQSIRQDLEPDS